MSEEERSKALGLVLHVDENLIGIKPHISNVVGLKPINWYNNTCANKLPYLQGGDISISTVIGLVSAIEVFVCLKSELATRLSVQQLRLFS